MVSSPLKRWGQARKKNHVHVYGYIFEQSVSTNPNKDERIDPDQDDEEYTGSNVYIGTTETYFRSNSEPSKHTSLDDQGMNFYIYTVDENIIAITKIRNNYGAIQLFKFDFSKLPLLKLSLLILLQSFLVSVLCFFLMALFLSIEVKILRVTTFAMAKLEEQ